MADGDVLPHLFEDILIRIIRQFGDNLASEHRDQALFDAAEAMRSEQGSRDTSTTIISALENKSFRQALTVRAPAPLTNSQAYQTFKADCLRAAHKPYQRRVRESLGQSSIGETGTQLELAALQQVARELSWTPPQVITISRHEVHTHANRMKAIIEDYFGLTWEWWPMAPRRHRLRSGYGRVSWWSPCGTAHYLDVPEEKLPRLHIVFDSVRAFMRASPVTKSQPIKKIVKETLHNIWIRLLVHHSHQPSTPSHSKPPRGRDVSSKNEAGASPSRRDVSNSNRRTPESRRRPDEQQSWRYDRPNGEDVISRAAAHIRRPQRHIYLCTQRGRTYRSADIECISGQKDRAFFSELKAHYIACRGFWRYYFSMWRYDHCEFYRISKYGRHACSPLDIGFPSEFDNHYDFTPRPPSPGPPHGPITEAEFRDRFYKSDADHYRWQTAWESTFYDNDDQAYQTLPKRIGRVALEDYGKETFYGLYAVEKRSFAMFLAYFFLCFLFPGFVFFCVYLSCREKASELPSAGWPISTALTLVSILMAELVHSREDKKVSS